MDKDLQRLHTYKNIYSWSLYISAKDEFTGHIAGSSGSSRGCYGQGAGRGSD